MSETNDFDPGVWKGHDFTAARKTYDTHVGRSYGAAVSAKVDAKTLVPEFIETKSINPLVIMCDVTGSMGKWPATIFEKLGYLEIEGKQYLGDDMEIAWGAVGDSNSDTYPLQIRPFTKGLELKTELQSLVIEGNGGGQTCESYELSALYVARNVRTPNAPKPICIIIGDEGFYDFINKHDAEKVAKVNLEGSRIESADVFRELMAKFSVYLIRKPYDNTRGDGVGPNDLRITAQWERVLGADRICTLPGPDRVVDVIFGILARESNKVAYFKNEIAERQKPEQVETVMRSLKTIHALAAPADPNDAKKSRMIGADSAMTKKTRSLI